MRQGCFRSAGCGSSGFDRRANLLKSYFSGFRPAGMHFFRRKNRFLLREVSRTFDWASPARSGFTTFCHQKVVPKVSAGRKSRGTADGLRLKRYADELAPAFSTAHPPPVLLPDFSRSGDFGLRMAGRGRLSDEFSGCRLSPAVQGGGFFGCPSGGKGGARNQAPPRG